MALIQSVANSAQGAVGFSLTLTLPGPTTAGNALVLGIVTAGASTNGTVGSVTLGGSSAGWSQVASAGGGSDGGIASFWVNPNIAGGQTSIVITGTGGTNTQDILCWADERDDLAQVTPFDKTAGAVAASGTAWSSGATTTTSQANEVWYGLAFGISSTAGMTISPPGAFTNHAQHTGPTLAGFIPIMTTGYQVVAATGACTYNGTFSAGQQWAALAVTFKARTAAADPGPGPLLRMPPGLSPLSLRHPAAVAQLQRRIIEPPLVAPAASGTLIRGRLAGDSGSSTTNTATPSLTAGWAGAAPQPGDWLFLIGFWRINSASTTTQTAGTGTWTIDRAGDNNTGGGNSFVAHRQLQAGDTDPTFTFGGAAATSAWAMIALTPSGALAVDQLPAPTIATVAANSFTVPPATAAVTDAVSLILAGAGAPNVGISDITPTPPAGWARFATDGADWAGWLGGAATRATFAGTHSRLVVITGTVTPGVEILNCAQPVVANVYHVLLSDTAGGAVLAIAGTATSASAGSGSLGQLMPLAGTATSTSAGAGSLGLVIPGGGTAATSSAAGGTLSLRMPAAGTAATSSAGSGTLTQLMAFGGAAAQVSAASGTLTGQLALAGTAMAGSSGSGAWLPASLAGTATGVSAGSGSLTIVAGGVTYPIAGTAASTSAGSGAWLPATLAGTSASASAAGGSLSAVLSVGGSAASTSVASGSLRAQLALAGTAVAGSSASGAWLPATLAGSSASTSSAAGILTLRLVLAGSATSASAASGSLTGQLALAGSASSASAASGSFGIAIAGTATSSSAAGGSLTSVLAVAGSAVTVSAAAGSPGAALPLAGSASTASLASGNLAAQLRLAGTALTVSAAAGAWASPQIAGTAASTSVAAGSWLPAGLAGTAVTVSTAAGVLRLAATLAGTAQTLSSASGQLRATGQLQGSAVTASAAAGFFALVSPLAYGQGSARAGGLETAGHAGGAQTGGRGGYGQPPHGTADGQQLGGRLR